MGAHGRSDPGARPAVVGELLEEWGLRPDAAPRRRGGAWLLPVTGPDGPADLEVHPPEAPGRDAHLALRHWDGAAAVRLQRADPRRRAMVLERLAPGDLGDGWDVEACERVAGLYASLHVTAPASLPRLSVWASARADELASLPRDAPVPHRMVAQAASLARALAADPATDGRLVHGALGFDAVVPAERGDVAVGPVPRSGDPHAEPFALLMTRWEEVAASHSARDRVRLRFHTVVDVAGLDEHRARDWVVVQSLATAYAALSTAGGAGSDSARAARALVTRCLTVAKAVQD